MKKGLLKFLLLVSGLSCLSLASWSAGQTIGSIANNITGNLSAVTKFLTAAAYVAGVSFMAVSLFQFKAHKENPTQVPLSKPMMLLGIGAALIFLPTITDTASATLFGQSGGTSSGPSGAILGA